MINIEEVNRIAAKTGAMLLKSKLTLSIVEATVCGLIGYVLTRMPGSSQYFLGSISPYSSLGKLEGLRMDRSLLNEKGSVSSEIALEMAHKVRILFDSDIGIAETGIAGPSGGTSKHPAGTFYVAIVRRDGYKTYRVYQFEGTREENRWLATKACMELVNTCATPNP